MVRMVRMVRSLADRTFQLWHKHGPGRDEHLPENLKQCRLSRARGSDDADQRPLPDRESHVLENRLIRSGIFEIYAAKLDGYVVLDDRRPTRAEKAIPLGPCQDRVELRRR